MGLERNESLLFGTGLEGTAEQAHVRDVWPPEAASVNFIVQNQACD